MASSLTYRHRVSGLVSEMEPGIAAVFADVLELVEPDAKPLAYVPIDADAVAALVDNSDAAAEPDAEAEPAVDAAEPKKAK